jgi:hypothetical protein
VKVIIIITKKKLKKPLKKKKKLVKIFKTSPFFKKLPKLHKKNPNKPAKNLETLTKNHRNASTAIEEPFT